MRRTRADQSERLYRVHFMRVYAFLLTLTRDPQAAEELTQETFFRTMTTESEFREESGEFTYLCAIAKNLFLDAQRRRKRQTALSDSLPSGERMEERAEDQDATTRIHLALQALPDPYRTVFELRVYGELSFREIAGRFRKTESWGRVTYHRARLLLRSRVQEAEK